MLKKKKIKNHLFCLQIKALNGYFKCMASLINKLGTSISQISIWYKALHITGFPSGLAVKIPPAMQEMQEMRVQSLGREDPLEEEMATHSSILARRISWTEEPGKLQSWGHKELDTTEVIKHARIAHYFLPMAIIKIAYDHSLYQVLDIDSKESGKSSVMILIYHSSQDTVVHMPEVILLLKI